MKAIVVDKYGTPKVLRESEVSKPIPSDDEVQIKVKAVSINPLDWHVLTGSPFLMRIQAGLFKPKYKILGADIAGVIEQVGKNVKEFKSGDEVFGDTFGSGLGGLAEYVCTSSKTIAKKPENISFQHAAATPVAGQTALVSLRDYCKIREGSEVLINGASGGVGTFTVQIAKSMGANVTGVCSTRNTDLVKNLGADQVIDYTKTDLSSDRYEFDAIVDNVGNFSSTNFKNLMKPSGLAAVVGFQSMSQVLRVSLSGGKQIKMVTVKANEKDLKHLAYLCSAGKINPVIDREYSLENSTEAMEYLMTGRAKGKVVININHN